MIAVALLSWFCFQEFARATGLFHEFPIIAVVMVGIFALLLANVDHYDRMYFSLAALTSGVIAVITLLEGDTPLRQPSDLQHFNLLNDSTWEAARFDFWHHWLAQAGVTGLDLKGGFSFNYSNLLVQANVVELLN